MYWHWRNREWVECGGVCVCCEWEMWGRQLGYSVWKSYIKYIYICIYYKMKSTSMFCFVTNKLNQDDLSNKKCTMVLPPTLLSLLQWGKSYIVGIYINLNADIWNFRSMPLWQKAGKVEWKLNEWEIAIFYEYIYTHAWTDI